MGSGIGRHGTGYTQTPPAADTTDTTTTQVSSSSSQSTQAITRDGRAVRAAPQQDPPSSPRRDGKTGADRDAKHPPRPLDRTRVQLPAASPRKRKAEGEAGDAQVRPAGGKESKHEVAGMRGMAWSPSAMPRIDAEGFVDQHAGELFAANDHRAGCDAVFTQALKEQLDPWHIAQISHAVRRRLAGQERLPAAAVSAMSAAIGGISLRHDDRGREFWDRVAAMFNGLVHEDTSSGDVHTLNLAAIIQGLRARQVEAAEDQYDEDELIRPLIEAMGGRSMPPSRLAALLRECGLKRSPPSLSCMPNDTDKGAPWWAPERTALDGWQGLNRVLDPLTPEHWDVLAQHLLDPDGSFTRYGSGWAALELADRPAALLARTLACERLEHERLGEICWAVATGGRVDADDEIRKGIPMSLAIVYEQSQGESAAATRRAWLEKFRALTEQAAGLSLHALSKLSAGIAAVLSQVDDEDAEYLYQLRDLPWYLMDVAVRPPLHVAAMACGHAAGRGALYVGAEPSEAGTLEAHVELGFRLARSPLGFASTFGLKSAAIATVHGSSTAQSSATQAIRTAWNGFSAREQTELLGIGMTCQAGANEQTVSAWLTLTDPDTQPVELHAELHAELVLALFRRVPQLTAANWRTACQQMLEHANAVCKQRRPAFGQADGKAVATSPGDDAAAARPDVATVLARIADLNLRLVDLYNVFKRSRGVYDVLSTSGPAREAAARRAGEDAIRAFIGFLEEELEEWMVSAMPPTMSKAMLPLFEADRAALRQLMAQFPSRSSSSTTSSSSPATH